jgi:hypothetical protein
VTNWAVTLVLALAIIMLVSGAYHVGRAIGWDKGHLEGMKSRHQPEAPPPGFYVKELQ